MSNGPKTLKNVAWPTVATAELRRITAPPLLRWGAGLGILLLLAGGAATFLDSNTDMAAAQRAAQRWYDSYAASARRAGRPVTADPGDFWDDPRYVMFKAAFVDMRDVLSKTAVLAVLFGVYAGTADWGSRVMLTLTATEPRRLRWFSARALAVALAAASAAAVAGALMVPVMYATAHYRGTLDGATGRFWRVLAEQYARGVLLAALLAVLGFALGMLFRRAIVALGVVLLYVAGAERLMETSMNGLLEYHLSGIIFAVLYDRPVDPDGQAKCFNGPECLAQGVNLTPGDAFSALLVYVLPVLLLALWNFRRRDVA